MTSFLYTAAKEKIISLIESNEISMDQRLPSERALAQKLGFTRMTIKKALNSLVDDHVLIRHPGDGTYLLHGKHSGRIDAGDDAPWSLTQTIKIKGGVPNSEIKSFKLVYDVPMLTKIFPDFTEFYELIRIRKFDDIVFSIQKAYIPFRLFEDAHRYDFSKISLYDYMSYKNMRPALFHRKIKTCPVTSDPLFKNFNVGPSKLVLSVEYLGYTKPDCLVEYTQSYFDSNQVDFKVEIPYSPK